MYTSTGGGDAASSSARYARRKQAHVVRDRCSLEVQPVHTKASSDSAPREEVAGVEDGGLALRIALPHMSRHSQGG